MITMKRHLSAPLGALLMALAAQATAQPAPDNTEINKRDRSGETLTPGDQSQSKADTELASNIRKAIVNDDQLSMNAKNIKIISRDGMVTLRGPVKSAAEREQIERIAKSARGVKQIDNQLEVE